MKKFYKKKTYNIDNKYIITAISQIVVFDGFTDEDDFKKLPPSFLKKLDGKKYNEYLMSEYFSEEIQNIGITGGYVLLKYNANNNTLNAISYFNSPRALSDEEITSFMDEYDEQMLDGIGENIISELESEFNVDFAIMSLYDDDIKSTFIQTERLK